MAYSATVSLFVMDVFEVTVGRFRAFVDAGMGTRSNPPVGGAGVHPRLAGSGWSTAWNTSLAIDRSALVSAIKCDPQFQTWTDTPGANETKPMNCVTWYEAMAFCIWDGGYLPTEAEWNFTASGGSDQRAYPWSMNPASSTTIDCSYANYFRDSPAGTHCVNGAIGDTLRVGARSPKGDGKWGHSDLAGNVWEWTFDGYGQALPLPCHDCANLQAADRVFRGGDFSGSAASLRVAVRSFNSPFSRDILVGLRCARAL